MKTIKVVYNACFGGFGLSKAAAIKLAALGVAEMQEQLESKKESSSIFSNSFYMYDTPRHDPRLVAVVEELGDRANGQFSDLQIAVLSGDKYRIDEYDGNETVEEPETVRDEWITVK